MPKFQDFLDNPVQQGKSLTHIPRAFLELAGDVTPSIFSASFKERQGLNRNKYLRGSIRDTNKKRAWSLFYDGVIKHQRQHVIKKTSKSYNQSGRAGLPYSSGRSGFRFGRHGTSHYRRRSFHRRHKTKRK